MDVSLEHTDASVRSISVISEDEPVKRTIAKPSPPKLRFRSALELQREIDAVKRSEKLAEKLAEQHDAQVKADRRRLRNRRKNEFKYFLKHDILSARDTLLCPSHKIAFSDEATALKACQKWVELDLHTLSGSTNKVYHCSCGHWHMTKKKQNV